MELNIISYTAEQLAALTAEQLKEVRSAQLKKNALEKALAERLFQEKQKLVEKGTYYSDSWALLQKKLKDEHDSEVEILREGLLFYLHYSVKPEQEEEQTSPYPLDYSLSDRERYLIVRDYYEATYSDGVERFNAFKADTVARQYLGELYAALYDYFLEDA